MVGRGLQAYAHSYPPLASSSPVDCIPWPSHVGPLYSAAQCIDLSMCAATTMLAYACNQQYTCESLRSLGWSIPCPAGWCMKKWLGASQRTSNNSSCR